MVQQMEKGAERSASSGDAELHPYEDFIDYLQRYTRERPETVALACLGIGFIPRLETEALVSRNDRSVGSNKNTRRRRPTGLPLDGMFFVLDRFDEIESARRVASRTDAKRLVAYRSAI